MKLFTLISNPHKQTQDTIFLFLYKHIMCRIWRDEKKNESFIYLHRYFYNIEKDTFLSKQKISIFLCYIFPGVVFMDIMIWRYSDRWCGFAYFFYLIEFFLCGIVEIFIFLGKILCIGWLVLYIWLFLACALCIIQW